MDTWNWPLLDRYAGVSFGSVNRPPTPRLALKSQANGYALTQEQEAIVDCQTNMKINAVAGSGKTTTLIEYARRQKTGSRGLYLAFNRTVREQAQQAFARKGVRGVTIHTAHSLAYGRVIKQNSELLASGSYSAFDLANRMQKESLVVRCMPPTRRKAPWTAVAAHSLRLLDWYCNEPVTRIEDLNYNHLLRYDPLISRRFADYFGAVIQAGAIWLWNQMDERSLKVTHDYYLKKFQLLAPQLRYDYILFDEGQDASPTMLDVFSQQPHARRVIVGDSHQQIYGFRHAVNSLNQVDFAAYGLTQSFRFPPGIARQARRALSLKQHIHPFLGETYTPQAIEGMGVDDATILAEPTCLQALIGRTNLQLVSAAIDLLCIQEVIGSVYFEGNFDTYTFMENGAGLLDMVLLQQNRPREIKNPLLRSMGSLEELGDYIDQTGDGQMKTALELVLTYGDDLPHFIEQIRTAHLAQRFRPHADLIFSTVHRSKGLEYDQVTLCDDFIDQRKLADYIGLLNQQQKAEAGGQPNHQPVNPGSILEEINMLYVGLTRTKQGLSLPDSQYYLQRETLSV
ncbi:UvrD-helicase domain-containing protein [Spirosoma pollinicola]|uniref:DNA 3'-5' helicase n=1 Tax=Spirosoma pollinicola TaxID=2057025 RepID=A0A2K8Z2G7_9BACT|nr:UvrD-helicase domain-containing protein [Spirosoma pollinicola]AUD04024.1 DNA helicase [Spirosoma pollinicola]